MVTTAVITIASAPCIAKSYTPSSVSSLFIVMVAVRKPVPEGVKVTSNVALPPAATEEGILLTTKSEACVPVEVIEEMFKIQFPVFWMV